MIEYTREDALSFCNEFQWIGKEGDTYNETHTPIEIIHRIIRCCLFLTTSDEGWEEEGVRQAMDDLLCKKPIDDMPLLINEPYPIGEIAKWRMKIAK